MNRLLVLILFIQPQLNFGQLTSKESLNRVASHPNWKYLNDDLCGISYADRIIGGKNASMGSYPWIVRIGYIKKNTPEGEITFRCGGSILNEYYVVTAAHCLANLNDTMVSTLRLGEHNSETNPDCENSFCNDPYQEYEPLELIPHEKFDSPVKLRNDIALIRLNDKIKFNDFVRPICVPKDKLLKKNFVGQMAEVAGWGVYDINEPQMSTTLQMVKLPVVENSRCEFGYRRVATVNSQQMCIGGTVGQDSCGGDSGGPLMKVEVDSASVGPRYYLIGLVSFGAKLCGETTLPGVYTKITEYLPWILDHLEP